METSNIKKDNILSSNEQLDVKYGLAEAFDNGLGATVDKLAAFPKYITRQDLSYLLARYELFKLVALSKGSIIECGVYYGNGLMIWAQLSAALEPTNYNRKIVGFDTFSGNVGDSDKDRPSCEVNERQTKQADYAIDSEDELKRCIDLYDRNRFLSHIQKVSLVRGDMVETVPKYLSDNPHLVVSLLSLTVNLYEPTKVALKHFLPRMSKGSILAIHTLNEAVFPGATVALLEELNIRDVVLQNFPYAPNLSFAVL